MKTRSIWQLLRKSIFRLLFITSFGFVGESQAQKVKASGIIFQDDNQNNKLDSLESAIAGVHISNGRDFDVTNNRGEYNLTVEPNQFIFPVKPSGYKINADSFNVAKFYQSYEEVRMRDQVNFGLTRSEESDSFKVAMLGDLQMRIHEEVNYANRLLTPELYHRDDLSFSVLLGDIADDSLDILFETRQIVKHFPMPTFGVFGNHDRDLNTADFSRTFNNVFGPTHYSFNHGNVHFIMLNDVMPTQTGGYEGRISEEQLAFIKNDLARVEKDQLIVFCQHIPLYTIANLESLIELLGKYDHVLAVSGHRHVLEQEFIRRPGSKDLHEVVAGAICGLWWDGERDWKGIPVAPMGFGAPKGYYVFEFHGNTYEMKYKAMELPANKQMNIWTWQPDRGDWAMQLPSGFSGNEVLVNVFAGSEKTIVQMSVDGGMWKTMKKVAVPDPYIARIINLEKEGVYPTKGQIKSGLKTENSKHIWQAFYDPNLTVGSHRIEVKAIDPFGLNAYEVTFFDIR